MTGSHAMVTEHMPRIFPSKIRAHGLHGAERAGDEKDP